MSLLHKSYYNLAALVLRLGAGAMMLPHGYAKLQSILVGDMNFADPIGIGEVPSLILAVFAEFVCSLLIMIGLQTRLASIPLMVTMAVAGFVVMGNSPWHKQELPLMFLIAYVAIFFMGSGKYSIDGLMGRRRE